MGIEGVVLSTSQMRLGIKEGTYTGWDDIRLGTMRALARRGILPEAVKNAMLAIGIGDTDISFSWDNLYAENRKIIDPLANRYFFVPDPIVATIEGVVLSTSQMRNGIKEGTYTGWDDIRLGTLRALARRGISPEAVKNAMLAIGIGDTDISFSWDNLYAENRKIVDPVANRYFFVPDPQKIEITNAPEKEAHIPLHPSYPERGQRIQLFSGSTEISKKDLSPGIEMIRLKDLFNVKIEWDGNSIKSTSYAGDSIAESRAKKAPIIQWAISSYIPCLVKTPDGDVTGKCEAAVIKEIDKVVQFERFGFVRIDSVDANGVIAYFTHK
jgi:glutamyl-tRNA synthetase